MILAINGVKRGSVNPNIILQSYVQTQEEVKRDSRTRASLRIPRKFLLLSQGHKEPGHYLLSLEADAFWAPTGCLPLCGKSL